MADKTEYPTEVRDPDFSQQPPDDGKISLCLSGGGYRAAIYHLGALRWLNECGVLPRLGTVSCVSGGSIVGAHLAYRLRGAWPTRPIDAATWTKDIEEPFWNFVNHNIRTRPVAIRLLPWNLPWSWSTIESLRKQYIRYLFNGNDPKLSELKGPPEFIFCATDMVFGVNWEACAQHVGDYEAGYASPPPDEWTVARAVAASSCFPPIFPPAITLLAPSKLKNGRYRQSDRDKLVRGIRLSDGGVYDNLGLQPVMRHRRVMASDGGGSMDFVLLHLPWRRLARYPALLQNGIGKLRKRILMADLCSKPPTKDGTYWCIADGTSVGPPFYDETTANLIAGIRTDLNRFTRNEFEILVNHGYLRAAEKTLTYCKHLLTDPAPIKSVIPPFPKWHNIADIKSALRWSRHRFWPPCLR